MTKWITAGLVLMTIAIAVWRQFVISNARTTESIQDLNLFITKSLANHDHSNEADQKEGTNLYNRLLRSASKLETERFFQGRSEDKNWDWKRPINLWGIVLDDRDQPIGSAKLTFSWTDLSTDGSSSFVLLSDSDGRFSFLGRTGKYLNVSAEKEGYRRCRWGSIGFEFANPTDPEYHRPDSNQPVVFRLIRKGPPEPLVHRNGIQVFRASEDPGTVACDLLGQCEVPPGDSAADLVIRTSHGPARSEGSRRWFAWRVELSVPDGGLQSGTECPPAAPEEGYQPRLVFEGKVEGRNSLSGIEDWFFLKTRGGRQYARVHLKVAALPSGGGNAKVALLEYTVNPAGSRNLEFYPEMQVAEKYRAPRNAHPSP